MADGPSESFEYRDKHFGDTQGVVVATHRAVFYPTSTTNLLLAGVRNFADPQASSALDLGCGCGIVAVVLARLVVPKAAIHASDISQEAVHLARSNAARNGVDVDCRCGSTFGPWAGMKFDLIVDDVAGMSEPIARISPWYPPQIHSDAGEDGVRWITAILSSASGYLTPLGQIFFPVLSLSSEEKILAAARASFAKVDLLSEQWYPLDGQVLSHRDLVEDLMDRGVIALRKKGSRWLWATKIYCASNR